MLCWTDSLQSLIRPTAYLNRIGSLCRLQLEFTVQERRIKKENSPSIVTLASVRHIPECILNKAYYNNNNIGSTCFSLRSLCEYWMWIGLSLSGLSEGMCAAPLLLPLPVFILPSFVSVRSWVGSSHSYHHLISFKAQVTLLTTVSREE